MQVVWSWTSLELNQSQEVPVRNMKGRIDGRHVDVAVSFVDAELASAPDRPTFRCARPVARFRPGR